MIFRFEDFEFDTARRELRAGGVVRAIQPQVFGLIELLLSNSERMVSKDEVVQEVWDGRFISDAALNSCVRLARQALDDDGKQQRVIKTIHGSGFRFVAELANAGVASNPAHTATELEASAHDLQDRPTIAVLPFTLLGAEDAQTAIADAIPAELISALSRLRWLKVIARGSSFQFRDPAFDLSMLRDKLGANYCLTGSVESASGTIALHVELNHLLSADVVWAERFSGELEDVFELRERIVKDVSNALELRIPLHEADALNTRTPSNLTAWGHYHVGLRQMYLYSQDGNLRAERHFKGALALDPNFARAEAALSFTEFQNYFQMFGTDLHRHRDLARLHAERAVELDPLDPFCVLALGRVNWLYGNVSEGLDWVDRSLQLNPNYAFGYYNSALLRTVLCDSHEAASRVETAIELSPLDPHLQSMLGTRAMSAFVGGQLEEAGHFADRAMRAPNPHLYVYMISAAIYAQLGYADKAALCVERIREKQVPFGKAEFLQHYDLSDLSKKSELEGALAAIGL